MSTIQGLRTVVRLKKRRVEQFEAALDERRQELVQQREALDGVQAAEARARAAEQAEIDRYLAMVNDRESSFVGERMLILQLVREEAAQKRAAAVSQTEAAQQTVVQAEEAVRQAQLDVQRAEQRKERVAERLKELIAARDREQEEAQDEEAEETAVARMVARSAAAKRAAVQARAQAATEARAQARHG